MIFVERNSQNMTVNDVLGYKPIKKNRFFEIDIKHLN